MDQLNEFKGQILALFLRLQRGDLSTIDAEAQSLRIQEEAFAPDLVAGGLANSVYKSKLIGLGGRGPHLNRRDADLKSLAS